MSIKESWAMYFSVIVTCAIAAGVIAFLNEIGYFNPSIFAIVLMVISSTLLFYFRKESTWVKQFFVAMILASVLIAAIGITG